MFVYLQRESSFGGHFGHQSLFFPLLKLAEVFLNEEGSVELPNCNFIVWKKKNKNKTYLRQEDAI